MSFLKDQFSMRVSIFRERTEFFDLSKWFMRIKSKANICHFGAQLDWVIKNKFLTGLKKGPILDEVFEEDHTRIYSF